MRMVSVVLVWSVGIRMWGEGVCSCWRDERLEGAERVFVIGYFGPLLSGIGPFLLFSGLWVIFHHLSAPGPKISSSRFRFRPVCIESSFLFPGQRHYGIAFSFCCSVPFRMVAVGGWAGDVNFG